MTVRTRFAPSPTGYLHIGGVRTALFNWLFARRHGGQFILRIDDTDQQRNVVEALAPILEGFRWLGIDWDEGPEVGGPYAPYYQSQRNLRYQEAVERLLASGHAYRDYATDEERQAERATAEQEKVPYVYSRRWMAADDRQASQFEAEGRKAVIRLKMPREGKCEFRDLIRGDVQFAWSQEQDHVIRRSDGTFLYHLASVVDDHDFQITHVIRAIEHLSNTPRQIFIAQGLGYQLPAYAHLPYVAAPGSSAKLSKRKLEQYLKVREFSQMYARGEQIASAIGLHPSAETFNPVIVDFYREVGYLPEAIINYLLLLGWSLDDKTEDFTREAMIEQFSLERVNKAPASFDPAKLQSFQSRRMQAVPLKQKTALVLPFLQKAGLVSSPPPCDTGPCLNRILEAAGQRIEIAGDILDYDYFFREDDQLRYDESAVAKCLDKLEDSAGLLEKLSRCLSEVSSFEAETLAAALDRLIESEGLHKRKTMQALRVAVTGVDKGVGTYETLELLGRERCLARIDRILSQR